MQRNEAITVSRWWHRWLTTGLVVVMILAVILVIAQLVVRAAADG
jgi:hypothetical protein